MNIFLLFAIIFLASVASVFVVAKKMKKSGILGRDLNKQKEVFLPEATGIALLVPIWIGIAIIIAFENFNAGFFVLGLALTGCSIIGLLDDVKKKFRGSLSWKARGIPIALFALAFSFLLFIYPQWSRSYYVIIWVSPCHICLFPNIKISVLEEQLKISELLFFNQNVIGDAAKTFLFISSL